MAQGCLLPPRPCQVRPSTADLSWSAGRAWLGTCQMKIGFPTTVACFGHAALCYRYVSEGGVGICLRHTHTWSACIAAAGPIGLVALATAGLVCRFSYGDQLPRRYSISTVLCVLGRSNACVCVLGLSKRFSRSLRHSLR